MKRFITAARVLLLLIPSLTSCHAHELTPLVVSQDISVAIQPSNHGITGTTFLTIVRRDAEFLRLRLSPRAMGISVTEGGQGLPFTFSDGVLVVRVSRLSPGRKSGISISYRAVFDDKVPSHIVSAEDPTYGVVAAIGQTGVFLESNSLWYPISEGLSPKEQTLTVTVPPGFEAITSGERITRRAEPEGVMSRWRIPIPVEPLSLSAGHYVVTERQLDGITVATYFSKENATLTKTYLDASAEYLRFYQGLFGPYPFKSFAVVENFFPTGYGFPGYTLIGSSVIRLPFIPTTSLPHEIAHCWWGNGVRVDSREGNWSEGLVTYLADYLLEERKSPEAAVSYRQRILADYASLVSPETDFPLRSFTSRSDPASRSIGYGKCAMLFHMVRLRIGDNAFFEALRTILQDRMFKEAAWSDFIRVFTLASGQDQSRFIAQWLDRPGGPRLSLADVRREREGGFWRIPGKVVQSTPLFEDLPITVRLENAGQPVDINITVDKAEIPFAVGSAGTPRRLLLDPDADVFRVLRREELPPTVNRVKGSREPLVIMASNCRADPAMFGILADSMGLRGIAARPEAEISPDMVRSHDLLICGVPKRKELVPLFDDTVTVAPDRFTVGSAAFSSSTDALFAVGVNPMDRERVAGLFLPLSLHAAVAAAPKITHYGKFGYLIFEQGENRLKGTFHSRGGGSVVEFDGQRP